MEGNGQRFPWCCRVLGYPELVDELEDALDVGVHLEDLEEERGLEGEKWGILRVGDGGRCAGGVGNWSASMSWKPITAEVRVTRIMGFTPGDSAI